MLCTGQVPRAGRAQGDEWAAGVLQCGRCRGAECSGALHVHQRRVGPHRPLCGHLRDQHSPDGEWLQHLALQRHPPVQVRSKGLPSSPHHYSNSEVISAVCSSGPSPEPIYFQYHSFSNTLTLVLLYHSLLFSIPLLLCCSVASEGVLSTNRNRYSTRNQQ